MRPLKLAICSWASGIGGGAARMESYYCEHFNREVIEPILISLVPREKNSAQYGNNIPYIQLDQEHRFSHLAEVLSQEQVDIVQFQGSFDPLISEVFNYVDAKALIEVLHNVEEGGVFKNIDCSICVSHAIADAQRGSHSKIIIPNGVDLRQFPFQKKKLKSDKVTFLQVGRRSKSKINLTELAPMILEHIPNAEFWICGEGHAQPENSHVKVLGVVDNILELYHQADYLIQLSDNEPFGLVALEAMACGIPVMLSNAGGFKEIVRSHVDGYLFDVTSHADIANKITKIVLTQSQDEYNQLRQAARKKVETEFDIKNVVKKYEDVIIKIYTEKQATKTKLSLENGITANALVGEALYDFQSRNYELLSQHLSQLSQSPYYIDHQGCLDTAHELSLYLYYKHPDLYPKGLFTYLFSMGNPTPDCLQIVAQELDVLIENNLFETYAEVLITNLKSQCEVFKTCIENYITLGYEGEANKLIQNAMLRYSEDEKLKTSLESLLLK